MSDLVHFDDSGLKKLAALFGGAAPVVRVGILAGPKMQRQQQTDMKKAPPTNAEIGAVHEFGSFTRKIPKRSFLHSPLRSEKARRKIVKDAAEGLERELARGEQVTPAQSFYGKIGAGLVAVVQDAFDQSGPGWKPLAESTIHRRRTRKVAPRFGTKPLIDLGELRRSISFRVMDGK